jgi:hypothetical protein
MQHKAATSPENVRIAKPAGEAITGRSPSSGAERYAGPPLAVFDKPGASGY